MRCASADKRADVVRESWKRRERRSACVSRRVVSDPDITAQRVFEILTAEG